MMIQDLPPPSFAVPVPGSLVLLDMGSLALFYSAILYFDYYLYCCTSIPYQKYKNFQRLFHIAIPFIVAPQFHGVTTTFIAYPWFFASVGAYTSQLYKQQHPKQQQTFKEWMISIGTEGFAQSQDKQANGNATIRKEIRLEGVKRVMTCLMAMTLGRFLLNPFLLDDPTDFLAFPWYSLDCLYNGFLIGFKGYILFLSNDMAFAIVQVLSGIKVIHAFNLPFLATSPKDFWGNRWNLIVRNLFRKQLYIGKKKQEKESTIALKRLRAFFISAVMHELIMTIVNRDITLEQFTFFMLQGVAVYLQSIAPKSISNNIPTLLGRVLTIVFLSLTCKLFIAPFMRYEEQRILFGKHSFI